MAYGTFSEFGQHAQAQQHSADDIDRDSAFHSANEIEVGSQNPRILYKGIQAIEGVDPLSECFNRTESGQIDFPDLNNGVGVRLGVLDGSGCRFTLGDVTNSEDDFGGVQTNKVTGCFEAWQRFSTDKQ